MPRKTHDEPVDTLVEDDGTTDVCQSDVFELRTCYRCDAFIPLLEPARLDEDTGDPCCEGCYNLWH